MKNFRGDIGIAYTREGIGSASASFLKHLSNDIQRIELYQELLPQEEGYKPKEEPSLSERLIIQAWRMDPNQKFLIERKINVF